MNRNMLPLISLLVATFVAACVEEPDKKSGSTLWDQYADELAIPDKDAATGVDKDIVTPADADTVLPADDDLLESPDTDAFVCMEDPCTTHADCKKAPCVATFCSAVLGTLRPNNPNVCAMRCDPANSSAECPDGMTCNGDVQMAAELGIDIDGAKGVCAPPTRR